MMKPTTQVKELNKDLPSFDARYATVVQTPESKEETANMLPKIAQLDNRSKDKTQRARQKSVGNAARKVFKLPGEAQETKEGDNAGTNQLRMVFDKINGDNYVYKTSSANQFAQFSSLDKKYSTITANGGFPRNANNINPSQLGTIGTLAPITEIARLQQHRNSAGTHTLCSHGSGMRNQSYGGTYNSQVLSEALKNQQRSNKYRFMPKLNQEESNQFVLHTTLHAGSTVNSGLYNTTSNFKTFGNNNGNATSFTPQQPRQVNIFTPPGAASTPGGAVAETVEMESTKTAELMSLNLKGVYQGSAGPGGAQTPRIAKLQTERFKKDKFNGTGILIPNKSIRAHKELTSERFAQHLGGLVSASRTPVQQTRHQTEHKNAYSVGLKGYTGFESQQDHTERWHTLEKESLAPGDCPQTNKFYARGRVSESLVPIYVTQAKPNDASREQQEYMQGKSENQLEFKGKYQKRKTFGKLSQNQELNDWKKQKCAGSASGQMLLKTKEEKLNKKMQSFSKPGMQQANEQMQKLQNASNTARNADSAPPVHNLDHHFHRRSSQVVEMPEIMNMSKGPRNGERQKTSIKLRSNKGLAQPSFLPKTSRLGKTMVPLAQKTADDSMDWKASASLAIMNPTPSNNDYTSAANLGHLNIKTVQGLREDIQGPSANRMLVIDSTQSILQNVEKIKFQNVYLREQNIKAELNEYNGLGAAAQLQGNSTSNGLPTEGPAGEAAGSADDRNVPNPSEQEQERQVSWQRKKGEIEDGQKNIINTHYFNSVTTAKLVQVGLDQVRIGPPRAPARDMASAQGKAVEQKVPFGFGGEAAKYGKQNSTQNAAHSARVFIFNKDGIQQAREMPDAALQNTHDIGVGIGTFLSNIQTSTTSGGLQAMPYAQNPTLNTLNTFNTVKMVEGSAETIANQYMGKRSLLNTLNVASFGETLGAQNSGDGNINAIACTGSGALMNSGKNSKVKIVQGYNVLDYGSAAQGLEEREEREAQQTLTTDRSPSAAKPTKEAAYQSSQNVDAEPVKLSNEKKMINLASLSQNIAEELVDDENEAEDQADKSEATNVSQQHHQIQKPIMINEDSVTDVRQGVQSPAFNKQPLIVEHAAKTHKAMRNSSNTVDDVANGNITDAEPVTSQINLDVRGFKTPAGSSRMATSPDRSTSIMNPTMAANSFDKQLTNNLNENSQSQFETPDNIKELKSVADSAAEDEKKKTEMIRSNRSHHDQDNKEARTTRGNHSNHREDSAEKSLDSARNSAGKYSRFTGISMQHGKQTKAQVLFPNMKPKHENDSKYSNTLKPKAKAQKQQSTQIMELKGRPGERPSLEKLDEQSGELHVKSGEFPFHKKLAGNFTTQVESHYQIDDLDNNVQKSKAELEAPGATDEEKEMSNRTIPSGMNGTKTPEEYTNIIILKKESAESTGSNKQQQRIYKISRPQSKCLLLETEKGEMPAEQAVGVRRINCQNLSNESGTLELLNSGFAPAQFPLSPQTLRANEHEHSPTNLNYQFQLQQQQGIQLVDLGQLLDESSRMQHLHQSNQLGMFSQSNYQKGSADEKGMGMFGVGGAKSSSPFQSPGGPPLQHNQDLQLDLMAIQPAKKLENQQISPQIEQQQQKLLKMQQNLKVFQQIDFWKQFENLKQQYENFYWQEVQKVKQQQDDGVIDEAAAIQQFTPYLQKPNMQSQAAGQTPHANTSSPRSPTEMPLPPRSPRTGVLATLQATNMPQMPSIRGSDPRAPTRKVPNQMGHTQYLRKFRKEEPADESPKSTAHERHLKFTSKVIKNLNSQMQGILDEAKPRDRSHSRSPPRALPPSTNKAKPRAVATMATGIFIEAIDQSEYKNRFVSQAYTPRPRGMDEQQIYNQLMTQMTQMTYMEANHAQNGENFHKNAQALIFNQNLQPDQSSMQELIEAKKVLFSAQQQPSDTQVGGTDHIASSMHERQTSPVNEETALANYLMQKEKQQSNQISKQSSFGLGINAFDKGETTSSFNNIIHEHLIKSDASQFITRSKGLQQAQQSINRGTMLATTSNQLLAGSQPSSPGASPKHADQSPMGANPAAPLAAASGGSLGRLNGEDLAENGGGGNLVMNVHPLELIEQPDHIGTLKNTGTSTLLRSPQLAFGDLMSPHEPLKDGTEQLQHGEIWIKSDNIADERN